MTRPAILPSGVLPMDPETFAALCAVVGVPGVERKTLLGAFPSARDAEIAIRKLWDAGAVERARAESAERDLAAARRLAIRSLGEVVAAADKAAHGLRTLFPT